MATDNPLGLEPSELAASKRAKEAAAARAAQAPSTGYVDQSGNATGYNADMATAMRRASQGAWGAAYPTEPAKPVKPVWTKSGVVHTANGDVDVDANGLAADGSKPVAKTNEPPKTVAKKAISSSVVTINGKQVQIITFDDGSTEQNDLGTDAADQAARVNIFDAAKAQMKSWGLYKEGDPASDALAKQLQDLATSGAGPDTISLALQNSDAYKTRFSGNAIRQANGMSVLSPAQYIQWENDVQSVLQAAGVPKGFYAGTDEMAKLIGANVHYDVLQQRVDLAAKSIAATDPFYTQQLQNLYGISQGDMIAHVLDPSVAMPLIQKQVSATTVAAEAARQGTNINLSTAEQLAGMGITETQARTGFQAIAGQEQTMQALASRYAGYGAAGNQGAALQTAVFGAPGTQTQAQAEAELKRLQAQETSAFSGSAGAGKGSLGIADTSGLQ